MIYKISIFRNGDFLKKAISVSYSLSMDSLSNLENVLVDNTFLTSVGERWTRHILTEKYSVYVSIVGIL
jgi:hypothetical protein